MRALRRVLTLVAIGGLLAVVPTGAVSADDDDWGPSLPGEFVVELVDDADPAQVAAAVGAVRGAEPLGDGSRLFRFVLRPTVGAAEGVELLENTEGVVAAQPNLLTSTADHLGLRKRFFADLGAPSVTTSPADYRIDQAGLANAGLPAPGATGRSVTVAVLDTGVDLTHPAFTGRLSPGGHDFVDRDPHPGEEANGVDDNGNGLVDEAFGHGTSVAGLVALVAPDARILPVRVLDTDGSTDVWRLMVGIAHAVANGADVVNLSLGGSDLGPLLAAQLEHLEAIGVAVVAAAGNSATDQPQAPAALPGVVGVTAIDGRTGQAAQFANRGSWVDVAAAGVGLTSTYPGGRYASWSGTSLAAPLVAGTLALLEELTPGAEVDDLVDNLTSTAVPAGLDGLSAYGRVDAAAALAKARQR